MTKLNQHTWSFWWHCKYFENMLFCLTSFLSSFLRYCEDITNLLFWVLWKYLSMANKNHGISFVQKLKFISHLSFEILPRYCKLVILGTLGTRDISTKINSIKLWKTLMFTYTQKVNLIPLFFLDILHLKEFCNMIGWEHFRAKLEIQKFAPNKGFAVVYK